MGGRRGIKVVTTEHGLKIGIYCPGWTGLSKSNITAGMEKLKDAGADILIFAPHWHGGQLQGNCKSGILRSRSH